jgi:chitodextrinase
LAAVPSDRAVVLSWTASGEADLGGYELTYKTAASSTWTAVSLTASATSYAKTTLVNGTVYQFRLRAKDVASNWSGYTEVVEGVPVDNVAPAVPTGLRVSAVNDQQATLAWTAVSATDLAGYRIEYKATAAETWLEVEVGKITSYTVTGLVNGEEHSFRIAAKDTSGNWSAASGVIVGTPQDKQPPAVPTGLKATAGVSRDVSLSWTGNSEPDLGGYEVAYLKYGTTTWVTQAVEAGATGTTVEGLVHNVSYSFKIRAKDVLNNWSVYSGTVSAIAKDLTAPAVPTGLAAVPSDRAVLLTWTANTEADLYGYRLLWKAASNTTWTAITLPASASSYNKTMLVNGTAYDFRLQARDAAGNWSLYTDILTVTAGVQ